jgi:hypothetical protein
MERERAMLGDRQFKIDPSRIVHETIEQETILIDLETGTYYSLRGCGAEIWALLVDGWTETEAIAEMKRRFPADLDAAAAATADLIAQLYDEGLLEVAPSRRERANGNVEPTAVHRPFEPPVLERYTDMQYFLLLDPIHEVHDGGWPRTAARSAERMGSQTEAG